MCDVSNNDEERGARGKIYKLCVFYTRRARYVLAIGIKTDP